MPKEIRIPKTIMEKYLSEREKKKVKISSYKRLGTGWHGAGYEIVYQVAGKERTVILRTQRPVGFSHDYPADRARSFLLQHQLSKVVPQHIRSIDVGGYTEKGELVSIGECKEFFQIVEKAKGIEYVQDLIRIKSTGRLTETDRKRALLLSNYLVNLHKKKFKGPKEVAESILRRHTRDALGHGEMFLGVLDTYPRKITWASEKDLRELIVLASAFRERIKDRHHRLSRMHGDFHPGNIIFKENGGFQVLDASRELWGDPADDITTLAINYIWYSLMQRGDFSGPFAELFNIFWNNYLKKTKDDGVSEIVGLFFAFRGVVVAHSIFYKEQSNSVRRKIFNFVKGVLRDKQFHPRKINTYIRG